MNAGDTTSGLCNYIKAAEVAEVAEVCTKVRGRNIFLKGHYGGGITAVCIIQGMRLFILKKNKCLMNSIPPSILHGMI